MGRQHTGSGVPPVTRPADRDNIALVEELDRTRLERIRKQAENYRTGLAGLIGLIATVSVVKGRDTFKDLPLNAKYLIAGLLAAALLCAVIGALQAMRAAFGPLKLTKVGDVERFADDELRGVLSRIRKVKYLTIGTLVLLVGAIAATWFWPPSPPANISAKVVDKELPVCGELTTSDAAGLTIKQKETPTTVPFTQITGLEVVAACE